MKYAHDIQCEPEMIKSNSTQKSSFNLFESDMLSNQNKSKSKKKYINYSNPL
jgi:hypothetical protein